MTEYEFGPFFFRTNIPKGSHGHFRWAINIGPFGIAWARGSQRGYLVIRTPFRQLGQHTGQFYPFGYGR